MTRLFRSSLLAALVAAPAALSAQAAACSIDYNSPKELVQLYNFDRAKAIQMPAGAEKTKQILSTLKGAAATKVAAANPLASGMISAQMLIFYMMQPPMPATATRGQLGLDGDKAATVDLAKMADSLFTAVETAQPGCLAETRPFREAKPWQDRINGAFKALAAKQLDSAESLAKASMVLDRTSPYAHRVFAAISQERGQQGAMLEHLLAALAITDKDTSYADDRRSVQFQIGQVALEYGETQKEPERTKVLKQGADAMFALVTESPTSESAPFAISGIGMAATSLKDSTMFTKCYTVVDAALEKFSDMSTLQAAVCANRIGKTTDAVRLFEATIKKNPNSRDGLYNAAALMYDQKRGKDMIPVVTKLVSLDPSNPDNISLFAYAYNRLHEAWTDSVQAAMKAAPKPKPAPGQKAAPAPAMPKSPWIDSVTKYMKSGDDMQHKVVMTEFNRYADKATLAGEIENRGKAARSFELELEFLDIAGNVLDKQTAKVGPVDAGKAGSFSLKIEKPKVAAWRYAPLK